MGGEETQCRAWRQHRSAGMNALNVTAKACAHRRRCSEHGVGGACSLCTITGEVDHAAAQLVRLLNSHHHVVSTQTASVPPQTFGIKQLYVQEIRLKPGIKRYSTSAEKSKKHW